MIGVSKSEGGVFVLGAPGALVVLTVVPEEAGGSAPLDAPGVEDEAGIPDVAGGTVVAGGATVTIDCLVNCAVKEVFPANVIPAV